MAEKWLSVSELAKRSQVPESTTRRYLTRFDRFFRYEERARGRRYSPDSVAVVAFIQSLYSEGMEAEEIEKALAKQFPITISTDHPSSTTQPPSLPMIATKDDLQAVMAEVLAMREEMTVIREENARLHRELNERLVERDRRLMETMQQMLEVRKEIATAGTKQKKWYQFWK